MKTEENDTKDVDLIRGPSMISVGDVVDIELAFGHPKFSYFKRKSNGESNRRSCRIAGEGVSRFYGLGYFVDPLADKDYKSSKEPFVLHLNEYGATWRAYYR